MTKKKAPAEPLRGEAAYLANKKAIAARNDAARTKLEADRQPKLRREAAQRAAIGAGPLGQSHQGEQVARCAARLAGTAAHLQR